MTTSKPSDIAICILYAYLTYYLLDFAILFFSVLLNLAIMVK